MNHQEWKFKTNLNCEGCVAKVAADLNQTIGIEKWEVDTGHQDKILTVIVHDVSEHQILELIKSKGFKAELLNKA